MKNIFLTPLLYSISLFYCTAQIPATGLMSYFPFSGSVEDITGNAIVSTVSGAVLTKDRNGIPDNAILFDGLDDYIEISNFSDLNPDNRICFSMWSQALISTSNCMLMLYPDDNSDRCTTCAQYKGAIYWDYGNIFSDGRMYIGSITFDTLWHHYVYQIDASEGIKQVYMDGILLKSESNSSTLSNMDRSLWIGGGTDANPGNIRFHGRIDELRIYNRTLDSLEVSWLYNAAECIEYHIVYDTIPIFDTIRIFDTVPVFDTIHVFDTTYVMVYDSISVSDTLIFEAVFTGLDSEQHSSRMKVYPNPARNMIYIDMGEEYEQMAGHSLAITNSSGAIVFITAIDKPLIEIDVRELGTTGLYILQVIDPGAGIIATKKILLE